MTLYKIYNFKDFSPNMDIEKIKKQKHLFPLNKAYQAASSMKINKRIKLQMVNKDKK